jgi:cytochrome c553
MRRALSAPTRRTIRLGLAAAGALALGAFLFLWSGLYTVAASRGHWAVTEWLLTFTMRNSVKTHAWGIESPPLDRPDLVALGAGHFHGGCAFCHGAPGMPAGPVTGSMLPPPPDLATQMRPWRDRELFWIVKHGIKYTGMPAWPAQRRDDEVWAVVAFLRRLPALDADAYRALALGELRISRTGREPGETTTAACAHCHGDARNAPASALVPLLHGQPVEFLAAALHAYANGRRASGIMQPLAADLDPAERDRAARYYAALQPPPTPLNVQPEVVAAAERGRRLAEQGDAGIPPCAGCHGAAAYNVYPRLAGQNRAYMANRLRLWKGGLAPGTAGEAIMAPIARALSERQIEDASAYFAQAATASIR